MDKDDIPKGIRWIGNIFQEAFDEIFHDVDELMKQAESQIVTAGTSVINFLSELDVVIGDALSQSSKDEKQGTAPVSCVVEKTDGIKSLVDIDRGCGDGLHVGSVGSVNSVVSSGLPVPAEEPNDAIRKKIIIRVRKFDKKTDGAVGIKSLVDIDRNCGDELHVGSMGSVNSVVSSGLPVEETNDAIKKIKIRVRKFDKIHLRNALQDIELDCGGKSVIPISDPVRKCYALKDTSTNLVNISAKDSDNKTDSSNASEEIGLDSEAKLLISASDDIEEFNSFMETVVDMSSSKSSDDMLSAAVDMDNEKSTADIEPFLADTLAISRVSNCNVAANLSTSVSEPEGLEQDNISGCDESEATMPFTKRDERENVVTESGLQTLGSLKKVELGEGCIAAEWPELECSSGENVKSWSYKDSFASKMRVLKKHNNDEEKNSSAILSLPDKSNLPNYESCDSDWEIV